MGADLVRAAATAEPALRPMIDELRRHDATRDARRVRLPVAGGVGRARPRRHPQRAGTGGGAALPDRVLPGIGHMPMLEAPYAFRVALRGFCLNLISCRRTDPWHCSRLRRAADSRRARPRSHWCRLAARGEDGFRVGSGGVEAQIEPLLGPCACGGRLVPGQGAGAPVVRAMFDRTRCCRWPSAAWRCSSSTDRRLSGSRQAWRPRVLPLLGREPTWTASSSSSSGSSSSSSGSRTRSSAPAVGDDDAAQAAHARYIELGTTLRAPVRRSRWATPEHLPSGSPATSPRTRPRARPARARARLGRCRLRCACGGAARARLRGRGAARRARPARRRGAGRRAALRRRWGRRWCRSECRPARTSRLARAKLATPPPASAPRVGRSRPATRCPTRPRPCSTGWRRRPAPARRRHAAAQPATSPARCCASRPTRRASGAPSRGVEPREDATNTDTRLRRNLIRHEVMPALRRVASRRRGEPGPLRRAAGRAGRAPARAGRRARRADAVDLRRLDDLPRALRVLVLREAAEQAAGRPLRLPRR